MFLGPDAFFPPKFHVDSYSNPLSADSMNNLSVLLVFFWIDNIGFGLYGNWNSGSGRAAMVPLVGLRFSAAGGSGFGCQQDKVIGPDMPPAETLTPETRPGKAGNED